MTLLNELLEKHGAKNASPGLATEIQEAFNEELRSAIREAVERCAQKSDEWATSKSCEYHTDNPCCHVRTGAGIAAAIRKLIEGEDKG